MLFGKTRYIQKHLLFSLSGRNEFYDIQERHDFSLQGQACHHKSLFHLVTKHKQKIVKPWKSLPTLSLYSGNAFHWCLKAQAGFLELKPSYFSSCIEYIPCTYSLRATMLLLNLSVYIRPWLPPLSLSIPISCVPSFSSHHISLL